MASAAQLLVHEGDSLPEVPGYRTVRKLASGGSAAVWEARSRNDDRRVALKVIHPTATERTRDFFRREMEIALRMRHPDIVDTLQAGERDLQLWMVMEYLEGITLSGVVRERVLDLPRRLEILMRTARALQHVHDAGFVHLDVKPSNIFLTLEGGLRLLDFGISRRLGESQVNDGVLRGTPRYVAPEVLCEYTCDERADVFALGVVAFELLAGVTPWAYTGSPKSLMHSVATAAPRPFLKEFVKHQRWFSIEQSLLERLHELVHWALELLADDRCPKACRFADGLEAILVDMGECRVVPWSVGGTGALRKETAHSWSKDVRMFALPNHDSHSSYRLLGWDRTTQDLLGPMPPSNR